MKGPTTLASPGPVASSLTADADLPLDWEAVYRRHAPDVARWAARLAGPTEDVDDLLHEVFLVVQAKLPEFRGDAKLTTWLYRITVNVVRHQRRKQRLRRWLGRVPDAPDPAPGPAETAQARQALSLVYRALEDLREVDRRVLVLHQLEGLSGPEIAELEGIQPSSVWVRLHRARKRFAAAVAKREGRS